MAIGVGFGAGVCSIVVFKAELSMAGRLSARPSVEGQNMAESLCLRSDVKRQGPIRQGTRRLMRLPMCVLYILLCSTFG